MNARQRLEELRRQAMARRRRVVFDNDGGDVASLCTGTTAEDLLDTRTKPAVDAGVDTYIYTTGWGFGIGLHDSRVGSVLRSKEGHLSGNMVDEFTREGTDCLRITSEYVRSRGTEFLWGMRMNDTHDAGYGGVFMPENRFKNEHPEVLFGPGISHGAVTAVDYASQEVRDFAVDYIMDVVDNYCVDGVFLDFFRHPIFFRSNAMGRPATTEETQAMTGFLRRVKEEMDRRRTAKELYYLTSVRVPDSVEYCRAIGLDIETWLAEGLADILFTASYLQLNEWEYSARLGHRYGVPVYPSLDESRVQSEYPRHRRNCLRGYYGRIMNVWDAGCDGVFMFNNSGLRDIRRSIEQNWFDDKAGSYQEALAATARGTDRVNTLSKTYFASFRGLGAVAGGALPHEQYMKVPALNHHAPLSISGGETVELAVRISDDPGATQKGGKRPSAVTMVGFIYGDPASVTAGLNGKELEVRAEENPRADLDPNRTEYVLRADVSPELLRRGRNAFSVTATAPATLLDLWVDLDYQEG